MYNFQIIECSCGYSSWSDWTVCPGCGKKLKDMLIPFSSNVKLKDIPDLIAYKSKKAKRTEADIAEPNGRVYTYKNLTTKEESNFLHEVMSDKGYRLVPLNKHTFYQGIFVKYDRTNKVLVFIVAEKEGTKKWRETMRFYVDRNKDMIVPCYKRIFKKNLHVFSEMFEDKFPGLCYRTAKKWQRTNLCQNIRDLMVLNETNDEDFSGFLNEVKKLFPELESPARLAGNKIVSVNNPYSFTEFLRHRPTNTKKSGPKQQAVDKLVKYPLAEVEIPEVFVHRDKAVLTKKDVRARMSNVDRFAVIEKAGDGICVLRTFGYVPEDNCICEGYRMYVTSRDVFICKKTLNGWIYQPLQSNPENWDFALQDYDKSITENTKLQYFSETIDDLPPEKRSLYIWAFLKYPIVEQIHKAGYGKLIDNIFCLSRGQQRSFEYSFYNALLPTMKGKNFLQKTGLNSYQFKRLNDQGFVGIFCDTNKKYIANYSIAKFIKGIVYKNTDYIRMYSNRSNKQICEDEMNIADLDKETFDSLFCFYCNFIKKMNGIINKDGIIEFPENRTSWQISDVMSRITCAMTTINKLWGLKSLVSVLDNLLKYSADRNFVIKYDDYIRTVDLLGDTTCFSPQIVSKEHIEAMHDMASAMYLMKKDEIQMNQWNRQVAKIQDWGYGDPVMDFVAIPPKEPGDLAREGTALCHCVKGYIPRVASGTTNIMFIRRKSEPDIPFFTVEIDNKKYIQQVHGFQNCNADTEPGLLDFIDRWCKAKAIKQFNFNKVR